MSREMYISRYCSPLGGVLLAADELGLTGLWFEGQKYFAAGLPDGSAERETPAIRAAVRWLDAYFAGMEPDIYVPLHFTGTPFRRAVWELLLEIPYGETVSYGELAARCALRAGAGGGSARAVGGAVGRNPISIIIPCHRVVGASGALTGYAGGLRRKAALLEIEAGGTKKAAAE